MGVLGLFWAESLERLWWLIDQANGDPDQYEYVELSDGFLAFTGEDEPVASQFEGNPEAGRSHRFEWSNADVSETLFVALHEQSGSNWQRFPAADQEGGGLLGLREDEPTQNPTSESE